MYVQHVCILYIQQLFRSLRWWPTSAGFCLLFASVKSPPVHSVWTQTDWIPRTDWNCFGVWEYKRFCSTWNYRTTTNRLGQKDNIRFLENLPEIKTKVVLTLTWVHVWFVFTRSDRELGHAVSWIKALFPVSVLRAGVYTQTWVSGCTGQC